EMKYYNPETHQIELFKAPDEVKFEVEDFNKKVLTESFNRTVCRYLAQQIDPEDRAKTLIFCATDTHADLVVRLLKEEFIQRYGEVADDAVMKITGAADKPLQKIKQYKNERLPNVAVTVDLLTTGIDVPQITNIVFLRRVNSRILFDQMLGRATRLCPEIEKQTFRIFDAVKIYEALQALSAMKPVVKDPTITFTTLIKELTTLANKEHLAEFRDQFLAKLQAKSRFFKPERENAFQELTGFSSKEFLSEVRNNPIEQIGPFLRQYPSLGRFLDQEQSGPKSGIFVNEDEDSLREVQRGYGTKKKPEDYIQAFKEFLNTHQNEIPGLVALLTAPQNLKRKELRELARLLDDKGFNETSLFSAWRDLTQQEVSARIVGFIRHAAKGDPLLSFDQRVDQALQRLLAQRDWTVPQRTWLQRIANQTKAMTIVDREALDAPDQFFRNEGGGFERLNKIFDGQLLEILESFNQSLWQHPAA
ncbi:MAG: type I restriction-modification enzyme R subunit C-terminal domain-containing protein, partial [Candidatus Sumerlaeia bacterium]|nr:type I restriction-modification enzyme R subunit C-terminal domain-containing protein [Candidatus Sumerlaeia bacterium]